MDKKAELDKFDRAVKDATIRSCTLRTNIESLDRQINAFALDEIRLEENLKTLKQNKIITKAEEFKRVKEELSIVRKKLIMAKNEKEQYVKSLANVVKSIEENLKDIEKINKIGENNVLRANFGKKNG